MNPTFATATPQAAGGVQFINIEYFLRLIYETIFGAATVTPGGGVAFNASGLIALFTNLWLLLTVVAYIISLLCLALIVYSTIRMHQALDADSLKYTTITDAAQAEAATEHHRWTHVRELIESPHDNDWRQAILEADIILDDMLTRLGYVGASVGDKLKQVNDTHFSTIRDAWEAHLVRNNIAHQGSAYVLTDHLAYRTILQYENVFKEQGEI